MNIVNIEERQVQKAVDILINAFADDPMFVYIFQTPEDYKKIGAQLFTAWVIWSMKYGVACMTEDENAVMLLRKIGSVEMTVPEMIETGMLLSPSELSMDTFNKFYMGIAPELEKRHLAIMENNPHWYVWMIAAGHKGKGLGSLLLKHCFDIADNDGLPVYLETSIKDNVAFYNKRGFELRDELHYKARDVPFYFMLKPNKNIHL